MARPAKAVNVMSKNLTKEERETRIKAEEQLKSGNDKVVAPDYLSKDAKAIFDYIVDELERANILTNLDIFILSTCAVAIERIQQAETILNFDLMNKEALKIKESYTKEFFRACNELSLSPQSRAKLANVNIQGQNKDEDPLLKALGGDVS